MKKYIFLFVLFIFNICYAELQPYDYKYNNIQNHLSKDYYTYYVIVESYFDIHQEGFQSLETVVKSNYFRFVIFIITY